MSRERYPRRESRAERDSEISLAEWKPKTQLGRDVMGGKYASIDELFESGVKISEPQIIDTLMKNLESDIILIGGSTGKGGGIRRTPSKRTSRMHKSGRRYNVSAMVIIGNLNGYVGLGFASGPVGKNKELMKKAMNKAKMNIIPIRRGCGSWECNCGTSHSFPFEISGKSGSVKIKFMPAPKGIGLCVGNEVKKIMRLAGVKDVWCKTRGQSQSRINLIKAVFDAFSRVNSYKISEESARLTGAKVGRVE